MSQVIAKSLSDLSVPAPLLNQSGDIDYQTVLEKISKRKASGMTIDSRNLKRNDLFSALCSEYKSYMNLEKTTRLPNETAERLYAEVDKYINGVLSAINGQNVLRQRKGYYHNSRQNAITVRITTVGENQLLLKEQLLGVHLALNAAKASLQKAVDAYKPEEIIQKHREKVLSLEKTELFIKHEMENQKKV